MIIIIYNNIVYMYTYTIIIFVHHRSCLHQSSLTIGDVNSMCAHCISFYTVLQFNLINLYWKSWYYFHKFLVPVKSVFLEIGLFGRLFVYYSVVKILIGRYIHLLVNKHHMYAIDLYVHTLIQHHFFLYYCSYFHQFIYWACDGKT